MSATKILPPLDFEVRIYDGNIFQETVGPTCFLLGVLAGVFINERIH